MLSQNLKKNFKIALLLIFIFLLAFFAQGSFFNEANFIQANEQNFCSQKNNFCDGYGMPRGFPGDISLIVIHVGEGSFDSIIRWFQNPISRVSAHYVISREGKIVSMVDEENIAWHAGNWLFNQVSVGIELEGYTKEKGTFTQEMYFALSRLLRHLIQKWKIKPFHPEGGVLEPIGIIGHNQVPNPKKESCGNCDFGGCGCKWDPGPYFDWNYLMDLVTGGGRPDLVLENIKIEPENFASGDEIKVSLLIKNQGKGDTIGSFFLNAYLDQDLIFQKEIPPLNKFESYNLSFSFFWPKSSKEYNFSLKIEDPYDYIFEENKDNNSFSKKLFPKINRPPKIKEVKILEEKKDELSISISAQDEDNDEIKYILASPKGILFDTELSSSFEKIFTIPSSDFQKPIFLQIKDRRGESSEVEVLQVLAKKEISFPEIDFKREIQNQKGEIQKEKEIYHFPIKIVFKFDPKYNLRYCFEKKCLPLLFDKNQISNEGFIEFSKSEDIILRYQILDLAENFALLVNEDKIILRKADINDDGKVGIADFSILMAMWQKTNSEKHEAFLADLNADGIVNLPDFSILMAYFEEI